MELKAIKKRKAPNYPTIDYFIENPELLSKRIPDKWLKNKYVASSLATFIFLGNPDIHKSKDLKTIVIVESIDKEKKAENQQVKQDAIKVAPIFVHGKGSGASGCIVMSPPVFISEDEALKIILEALKAENISFDTVKGPVISFKALAIADDCLDEKNVADAKVKIKMDGYNAKYNIAFEFVSTKDFNKFRSDSKCFSSVQGYDTKKAAELLRDELKANSKTNAVVFYDPISHINFENSKNWKKSETKAKEESKKLLLEQVNDFIKWIKKEHIIAQ
ncbi:MAG: hypothetical protein HXX18_06860 [Bacteroidetes bacterium]|nr:hypothetical protein [Bacteroidota bacterium]